MTKLFLLMDGRAKQGLLEDAVVMDTAESEEEAREEGLTTWKGHDALWFESNDENESVEMEHARWDPPPCEQSEEK